ncbi:hypothetical protein [Clostridium estertheticum]|uniref:hypothetical protein n=1 Tax=Clostridium estertheticum TaxID=238834 RepID=UPI001CF46761|nr:hypothetical protein [Clostridium estertheticum]MCB2362150.1 hypothetical protein [Clostridium estertheticum]
MNKFVNVLCTDAHVETLNEIDGVFVNDKVGATIYTLIKTLQNMNMMLKMVMEIKQQNLMIRWVI